MYRFLQRGTRWSLIVGRESHMHESRKLNEHEVNYVTHDLELVAIIHALKMWRHYLLGKKFTLMTDHSELKHLFG